MALAGLTPPATLAAVYGYRNHTTLQRFPTIEWANDYVSLEYVAMTSAKQAKILDPAFLPAGNISFGLQFNGTSVKCSNANSSQEDIFNDYTSYLVDYPDHPNIWTEHTLKEGRPGMYVEDPPLAPPSMLLGAILAPFGWKERINALSSRSYSGTNPPYDPYQRWVVPDSFFRDNYQTIGSNCTTTSSLHIGENRSTLCTSYVPQLWIQTASESLVCLMGTSSYDVNFEYVNGIQKMVHYSTNAFEPLWTLSNSVYNYSDMYGL